MRPGAVLVPGSVPQLGGDDPLVDAVRLQKPYYGRLGSVHRHDVLEQDPEDDQVEGPAPRSNREAFSWESHVVSVIQDLGNLGVQMALRTVVAEGM